MGPDQTSYTEQTDQAPLLICKLSQYVAKLKKNAAEGILTTNWLAVKMLINHIQ